MDGSRVKRILDISRRVERARKGELANAERAREEAQADLDRAVAAQSEQLAALGADSELGPDALLDRARFVLMASEQVKAAERLCREKDGELSERQASAFEATRDVRKFEVLDEKHQRDAKVLAKQAEQRELDELSAARRGGAR